MSDDRPRVWDMPVCKRLETEFIENGYGQVVLAVDAHVGVDTTAMKLAALHAYGMSRQLDNEIIQWPDGLFPDLDPNSWIIGNAPVPVELVEIAKTMYHRMLETVQLEWEGEAYEAFKTYCQALSKATEERLAYVGSATLFGTSQRLLNKEGLKR